MQVSMIAVPASRSRRRRAFTLVELLIVIAIIGTLVGLLLPAVQAAREAGRQTTCRSNQKQIGLALLQFHDARKMFPCGLTMGYNPSNPSVWNSPQYQYGAIGWGVRILPYIEEKGLYDQVVACFPDASLVTDWNQYIFQKTSGGSGRVPLSINQLSLPAFNCPTDAGLRLSTGLPPLGKSNYIGNCGPNQMNTTDRRDITGSDNTSASYYSKANCDNGDYGGILFQGHPPSQGRNGFQVTLSRITDGTSKTLLLSERSGEFMGSIGKNRMTSSVFGGYEYAVTDVAFSTFWTPNSGGSSSSTVPHSVAASLHPGGVIVCFADGAVQFIQEGIAADTWKNLGGRSDGQTTGDY